MARPKNCPKCDADISDSYQPQEDDVGISGGWYCDACDLGVADEDGPEPHDDDVMISGTGGSSHVCACGTSYEMGYGLAGGGGIGPYMYCPKCEAITNKSIDPEMT